MATPPAFLIIAAVSSIVSGRPYADGLPLTLRPVQYTVAPASASARAMPRPAPRVAPATSATFPDSGLRDDVVFLVVLAFATALAIVDSCLETLSNRHHHVSVTTHLSPTKAGVVMISVDSALLMS